MVIELVIGRGWKARLDGLKPKAEWEIGDPPDKEGGDHAETYFKYTTQGLRFGSPIPGSSSEVEIEWIAFDIPNDDWVWDIDGTRIGPTEAFVKLKGEDDATSMGVTECWYLHDSRDGGPTPKGVMLEGGEWVEIDETQAYVRLEERE
jgi:hypothetical protein